MSIILMVSFGALPSHADTTDFPFAAPELIPLPEDVAATSMELTDHDGDGDLDAILSARSTDHVIVMMEGGPGGSLTYSGQLEAPEQTDWLQTGDLDGDGDLDLVAAVRSVNGLLAIYDGDGDGGFAEPPRLIPVGREVRSVRIHDMNDDGAPDLVALGHRTDDCHVLLGDGSGDFSPVDRRRLAPWKNGSAYPQSVETFDLDGDGIADPIMVSIGARSIHVAIGGGDGRLETPRAWVAPDVDGESGGCAYVSVADFDSDGRLEILAPQTTWGQQWFIVFELDDAGSIVSSEAMMGSPFGISWISESADFDGDGDQDLCIGHALPGVIVFMENVSVPGGGIAFNDPQWFFAGEFIRHLVASDIDFDGDQDLLALDYTGDQILLFRNGSNPGMFRSGSGSTDVVVPPVTEEAPGPFRGLDGASILQDLSRMTPSEILAIAEERDRRAGEGAD